MENSIKISDNKQVNINEAGGFKKLLAETDLVKIPKVGDILLGKVIDVSRGEIRIDIEGLTTGVIRGRELLEAGEDYADLKIGDSVEATVIDLENENGEMELSFRFAGQQKAWHDLNELKTEGKIVKALITDANKGGLMIKVGKVAGFLPVSQLMPEHYPRVPGGDKNRILDRLKSYIGQEFEVKVIDATEAEDKLIVSEKAAWEEKQKDVIASYKVGDMIEGVITAVTDFGVFVEFGSDRLEGLVHISELAWQRIDNPNDLVKVGDKIQAAIINVEGSKIFLSMKKLKEDPWKNALTKYQVGQSVSGKVLKVNPFGLFVELDPEIHGLAHVSELAAKASVNPMEIAKPGDVLSFKILSIEPSAHRLGLSLKISQVKPQTNPEPEPAAPSAEPTLGPAEPAEPAAS